MKKLKLKKGPDISPAKKLKPRPLDELPALDVDTRVVQKYETQRCAFVYPDGTRCKSYAMGSSTLCKVHAHDKSPVKEFAAPFNQLPESYLKKTKFDPGYHPMAYIRYSKQGMSDVEIAAEFQISMQTMKGWVRDIQEFQEAYDIGNTLYEAFFLRKGTENLENDRFNNTLFKYLTMNKLGYSDKVETRSTSQSIHGVMLVPGTVSIQDWEKQNMMLEEQEQLKRIQEASEGKISGPAYPNFITTGESNAAE